MRFTKRKAERVLTHLRKANLELEKLQVANEEYLCGRSYEWQSSPNAEEIRDTSQMFGLFYGEIEDLISKLELEVHPKRK